MSLQNPTSSQEQYIHQVRLYMERLVGGEIVSELLQNQKISLNEEQYTVDLFRFRQIYPNAYVPKNSTYLDFFVNPVSHVPNICLFGGKEFFTEICEPVHPKNLEPLFCLILRDSKQVGNKVLASVQEPKIH